MPVDLVTLSPCHLVTTTGLDHIQETTMPTQKNRILHVSTPLGPDVLMLGSFSGTESISQLFSYHLSMVSEKESIEAKDIVGKSISWKIQVKNAKPRFFNGVVGRFASGGKSARHLR